ncbi:UNVERIFIED_CONTAM: Zinc finger BED domain-containing protein RICESLEEPER 2 [Sesamum radiatum]|uniref:Zinc finger BED domain-containing protein RICESLEEPER 2 n=1 Tax=Sesamum radiatum TaxID=300843 RepID=A0AAW2LKW6_SESRA
MNLRALVTEWWKLHTPRFPVLARLARDVVAMPISTVASESAFSTGGHIIDDFRASLTPKMAQALIYCQDYLRCAPFKPVEEDYDAIDKIVKDVVSNVTQSQPSSGYDIVYHGLFSAFLHPLLPQLGVFLVCSSSSDGSGDD